jgi:hypothetical protein
MRLSPLGLLVTLALGLGLFWPPHVATAQQPGKVYQGVENHSCNISDGRRLAPLCSGHHVRLHIKQSSL